MTFAGPVGGGSSSRSTTAVGWNPGTRSSPLVARRGDAVSAGQVVARSGTGHAGDLVPNLHFAVLLLDVYVDPLDYLGPVEVWRFIRLAPLTVG